jgi:hypothetical protein
MKQVENIMPPLIFVLCLITACKKNDIKEPVPVDPTQKLLPANRCYLTKITDANGNKVQEHEYDAANDFMPKKSSFYFNGVLNTYVIYTSWVQAGKKQILAAWHEIKSNTDSVKLYEMYYIGAENTIDSTSSFRCTVNCNQAAPYNFPHSSSTYYKYDERKRLIGFQFFNGSTYSADATYEYSYNDAGLVNVLKGYNISGNLVQLSQNDYPAKTADYIFLGEPSSLIKTIYGYSTSFANEKLYSFSSQTGNANQFITFIRTSVNEKFSSGPYVGYLKRRVSSTSNGGNSIDNFEYGICR